MVDFIVCQWILKFNLTNCAKSWENCRTAAADVGSLCPVLPQPTLCTEQLWVKQYVFLGDTQRSRHITGKKVSAIIELCSYAIHTPCARAVQLNCVVLRVDRQCKCAAPPTWEYHREYAAELFRAKRMYDCRSAEQRECTIVDLQSRENVRLWICRAKRMYSCRSAEQRECTIVDLQSSENVQL